MTALREYQHLESGGLWRADTDAQRRDVIVSFGDATLVISDTANRPLSHWSLPAVARLNSGTRPALYSPDPNGTETLEIDDDYMIDAIEKVRITLGKRQPRQGRLRWLSFGISTAIVLSLILFWLPNALTQHTLTVVPAVKRVEIGANLLGHIQSLTGTTCRAPLGNQALRRLQLRSLGPDAPGQIVVLPAGPSGALYLPGGIITLNRAVVEDPEDPATAAGHVVAAAARIMVQDPIEPILRQAGLRATLRFLTTGDLPPDTLQSYAEVLVASSPERVSDDVLLSAFAAARIPSTPFAYDLDITGEKTISLIEADPLLGQTFPLILADEDWISLQGICGSR